MVVEVETGHGHQTLLIVYEIQTRPPIRTDMGSNCSLTTEWWGEGMPLIVGVSFFRYLIHQMSLIRLAYKYCSYIDGLLQDCSNCVCINGWVNNREAGDLRRYLGHYDVIVMATQHSNGWYIQRSFPLHNTSGCILEFLNIAWNCAIYHILLHCIVPWKSYHEAQETNAKNSKRCQ